MVALMGQRHKLVGPETRQWEESYEPTLLSTERDGSPRDSSAAPSDILRYLTFEFRHPWRSRPVGHHPLPGSTGPSGKNRRKTMRFGLYLDPQTPGPADDGRVIKEVLELVDLSEQIGFENVWITDHQFTGYNVYSDPLVLASTVAQRNKRLQIGLAVAVVPLMQPVRFVTQCNLVDQLAEGRFVVGIGPGNSPDEYKGYGLDASVRHTMLEEFIDVMEKAWTAPEEGFSYEGPTWSGTVRGRIIPAPYQGKRPHIVYVSGTPERMERAGRRGWSLLLGPQNTQITASRLQHYINGMNAGNHDEATRQRMWRDTGFVKQLYVAAPGEDWLDHIGSYLEIYARKSLLANTGIDDLSKDDLAKRVEGYLKDWLVAGTEDQIIERLTPFAQLGVGHMMCWFYFGHMPIDLIRNSVMRFASNVMPVLRDVKPDPDLISRLLQTEVAPNPSFLSTQGIP